MRIEDRFASGIHSRVYSRGPSYYVEDMNSTNGTFLNGGQLEGEALLSDLDEIRIGDLPRGQLMLALDADENYEGLTAVRHEAAAVAAAEEELGEMSRPTMERAIEAIEEGGYHHMQSFSQHLVQLVLDERVEFEVAAAAARTVKREWQAAWLLRAITLIDLTTLSGDDTPGNVRRLCAKARHPLRDDILDALGARDLDIAPRAGSEELAEIGDQPMILVVERDHVRLAVHRQHVGAGVAPGLDQRQMGEVLVVREMSAEDVDAAIAEMGK